MTTAKYACVIDWHTHPMRSDRWLAGWLPAVERSMAFGARGWTLTRALDDPLHFRQTIWWDDKDGFESYWASDEVAAARETVMSYYNKPLLPSWHTLVAEERVEPAGAQELVAEQAEV
jgi:hypothetical protein